MDKNFNFVDFGFEQVSSSAEIPGSNPSSHSHEKLSFDLPIAEEGYIYLYVSNESQNNADVYFDDFKVTHVESKVVQTNDFYPFGLAAESFSRLSNIPNKFLYNSGAELNEISGNYETFYRHYDPVLGRFNSIDPLASSFVSLTPYQYANNDPVLFNDPLGDRFAREHEFLPSATPSDGDVGRGAGGYAGRDMRLSPGSSQNWMSQFSSQSRDYFVLSRADFESKYGESTTDYADRLYEQKQLKEHYKKTTRQAAELVGGSVNGDGILSWFAVEGKAFASRTSGDYAGGLTVTPFAIDLGGLTDPEHVDVTASALSESGGGTNWGIYIAGIALTLEDGYSAFLHDHNTYKVPSSGKTRTIINPKTGKVRVNSKPAANALRNSKILKGTGIVGTALMTGVATYNIVDDFNDNRSISGIDVADAVVGGSGLATAGLASAGLVSNPVGWTVGTGVTVYSLGRLMMDLGSKYGPSRWYGTNDRKWFE